MLHKHSSTVKGNNKQEDANFHVCATEMLWMPSLEDYFAIYFLEGDIQHLSFSLEFMIKSLSSLMKQTNKQLINCNKSQKKNKKPGCTED